jgi:uncharacterized protein (DUF305 family)
MQTKPLLYGLIGFFIGGLLVAVAAATFDKPKEQAANSSQLSEMSMSDMTASLKNKTGDEYDRAFINYMIDHHQSAVDMANLSAENAKHDEIRQLSNDIVAAQEKEISRMHQWQMDWGYSATMDHDAMGR